MPRDVAGIAVVVSALLLFGFAYRQFRRERDLSALLLIAGAGFLLRAFTAGDLFLHSWDERYHALVAKNLAHHPWLPTLYEHPLLTYDFRSWGHNHIWLHKQPLTLWLMALSMKCLGFNEIALRLPSVLLSTLAIGFTYHIGRDIGGRRVGLLAAFLHAIHGLLIELPSGRVPTDHISTVFIVMVEAGILVVFRSREWNPWTSALAIGSVTGLAALAQSPASLVILVVWIPFLRARSSRFRLEHSGTVLVAVLAAAWVYVPWQVYIGRAFPEEAAWEALYNVRHLTEVLEGHGGGPLYYVTRIPEYFGEISYLPLGWFFYTLVRQKRDPSRIALALWFLAPLVFFSLAASKGVRYVMITAPAVFMMVSLFWWHVRDRWLTARRWRFAGILVLVLLVGLPARFCIERVKPIGGPQWHAEWAQSFRKMGREFQGTRAVVFNTRRPIELMFYSSLVAYPQIPTEAEIGICRQQGYGVLLLDDGDLPKRITAHPNVVVLPRHSTP